MLSFVSEYPFISVGTQITLDDKKKQARTKITRLVLESD